VVYPISASCYSDQADNGQILALGIENGTTVVYDMSFMIEKSVLTSEGMKFRAPVTAIDINGGFLINGTKMGEVQIHDLNVEDEEKTLQYACSNVMD